jgi:hypothetical protein
MKSLTPNKTRNQVETSKNGGFFWTNNKPIEFEKRTIRNGIPFIERHKGIILFPKGEGADIEEFNKIVKFLDEATVQVTSTGGLK